MSKFRRTVLTESSQLPQFSTKGDLTVARLTVTPSVEAGLDRGGEDLYLDFYCEVDGETPPTEFEVHLCAEDSDLEGCSVELLDEEAEDEWARQEDAPYNGPVRYTTHHCEFEWRGTPTDALKLVQEELSKVKCWRFCHRPGESPRLRFSHSHYVDGNAE